MTQAQVSVGISIRCDHHDFSGLADSLDQAQALGVDTVERPTMAMDLVANGRMRPERVRRCGQCSRISPLDAQPMARSA